MGQRAGNRTSVCTFVFVCGDAARPGRTSMCPYSQSRRYPSGRPQTGKRAAGRQPWPGFRAGSST